MPWWVYLLVAAWFTGWWVAYTGWWLAYFQGEFPELYSSGGLTVDELHALGVLTPREEYLKTCIHGTIWSFGVAVFPFIGLACGPIWKHGWENPIAGIIQNLGGR